MSINIAAVKAFMVPDENGNIDFEKSGRKYLDSLQALESLIASDEKAVKEAVTAVFDKYKGTNVTNAVPIIMRELPANPDTYNEMEKRVKEYLKMNTGEYGEAMLGARKGIGGGVWRWVDKGASSKEVKASLEAIAERNAKAAAAAAAAKPST